MKATGIIRRVDDLGRIVIPKEIRRTLKIREGDPLEIFTGRNREVIFKEYSIIGTLEEFDFKLIAMMEEIIGATIIVTNRNEIVGYSPRSKSEFSGRLLSTPFIDLMNRGETEVQNPLYDFYTPIMDNYKESKYIVAPIIVQNRIEGSVVLLNCENATEEKIRKCDQLAELFTNKFQ